MAKKSAAKTGKTSKATDPAPDPNDPAGTSTNTGNLAGDIGNTIGGAISGAASSITTPFGDWFNGIEADVMNMMNQIFNSTFFGFCVALGAVAMLWGLYQLFKDSAPVEAVKSTAKTAAAAAVVL